MLGLIFFMSVFSLALIILLLSQYYKMITRRIFGRMDDIIKKAVSEGKPPDNWVKRAAGLERKLKSAAGGRAKRSALERHVKFVEADARNLIMMAERTGSYPGENERADAVAALYGVCEKAVGEYRALLADYPE